MFKATKFVILLAIALPALSWQGTDEDGNDIEIGKGNLVRRGLEIEYERHGESVSATVDSIRSRGRTVEVEVTDDDGESHTLEMERR